MVNEYGVSMLPMELVKMFSGERHRSGAARTPRVWVSPSELQIWLVLDLSIAGVPGKDCKIITWRMNFLPVFHYPFNTVISQI